MAASWTYFGVTPGDGRGTQLPQVTLIQILGPILSAPSPVPAKENAIRGLFHAGGAHNLGDETDEYLRDAVYGLRVFADADAALVLDELFQ